MDELVFLKLGGSLITEKTEPYTPRLNTLGALACEIRDALEMRTRIQIILGHGSGSFGHIAVQEHLNDAVFPRTGDGRSRSDTDYWNGFAEVWYRASQLNRFVVEACRNASLPVIAIAPSSAITTSDGRIVNWDLAPVRAALSSGVVPLIFGDIVFDEKDGSKVLSTEALMWHLAVELRPRRILLAGLEAAVWADFPSRMEPISRITPATYSSLTGSIGASHGPDVTGGMQAKVDAMLELVKVVPGLQVRIFSGEEPGNLTKALLGESLGTLIASD